MKTQLYEKYGGEEYTKTIPKQIMMGQNELFTKYTPDGRVIETNLTNKSLSKYPEDVYLNNHTSVWGSYYSTDERKWGFKCCRQSIKQSYCSGEMGIKAKEEIEIKRKKIIEEDILQKSIKEEDIESEESKHKKKSKKKKI